MTEREKKQRLKRERWEQKTALEQKYVRRKFYALHAICFFSVIISAVFFLLGLLLTSENEDQVGPYLVFGFTFLTLASWIEWFIKRNPPAWFRFSHKNLSYWLLGWLWNFKQAIPFPGIFVPLVLSIITGYFWLGALYIWICK